ncbi:MAG: RecX family transcriptional regulator [Candidatus Omnitrophota bacterium]|nr:MAG: RecX family transcriptional regulator [Candidatus Omnitrophota bacterium]
MCAERSSSSSGAGSKDSQFKKALNYSFLLLKYRARSKGEIISRLKLRGVAGSLIDRVIDYLQEYNYINDGEFARGLAAASLKKGWGPRKIESALGKLKISQDLREEVLKDKSIYNSKIRELIEKRVARHKDKKNIFGKVLRYMVNRGFEYQDIIEQIQRIEIKERNKII